MKDPAFLFYSSDFLVGVMTLTMEERGQYITLLAMMHQQGRMDLETIRFLVGSVSDKLLAKFQKDEHGMYYNRRLEEEAEKRAKFTESRRNNGAAGGRPPATKKPKGKPTKNHKVKHMSNHMEDENEDVNINKDKGDFEEFWDHYHNTTGRKRLNKEAAFRYWVKLSQKERQLAKDSVQGYVDQADVKDPKFYKLARTYLSDRVWEDFDGSFNKPDYDNIVPKWGN